MSSTPIDTMGELSIGSDVPKKSTAFCASDADVTFRSHDGVLFLIHRKNLETSTGGYAPAGFSCKSGDIVSLSEDAETLELLFKFVYPARHPTLLDSETPFELLASLAEAAEKYEVFGAINICYIRMEQALWLHPVEVLNYGAKHGYQELVKTAVPRLLDMPLEIVVKTLSDNLVVSWIVFRQSWSNAVVKFIWTPIDGTHFVGYDTKKTCKFGCIHGGGLIADVWKMLGERRSVDAVIGAYARLTPPCMHITIDTTEIRTRLNAELGKIPAFSA